MTDTGALVIIYMISVMLLFFQRTQKSPGTSFTMLRGRGEVDTDWSLLQNIHVWMQQNRQSVINWRKMCRHKAEITAYQCSKSNKIFEKRKWLQESERKSDFWSQNIQDVDINWEENGTIRRTIPESGEVSFSFIQKRTKMRSENRIIFGVKMGKIVSK